MKKHRSAALWKTRQSCRCGGVDKVFKKCLSQNSFRFVTDAPLKNGREQRGGGEEEYRERHVWRGPGWSPRQPFFRRHSWFIRCSNTHTHTTYKLVCPVHWHRQWVLTTPSHVPNKTPSSPNYVIAQMVIQNSVDYVNLLCGNPCTSRGLAWQVMALKSLEIQ